MANQHSQAKDKAVNPKGKPSREEISRAFTPFVETANRAMAGLITLADFLVSKNVISGEELLTFVNERNKAIAARNADLDTCLEPAPQGATNGPSTS
jgi:hypothetical protein